MGILWIEKGRGRNEKDIIDPVYDTRARFAVCLR
jgi:hypothetical protein